MLGFATMPLIAVLVIVSVLLGAAPAGAQYEPGQQQDQQEEERPATTTKAPADREDGGDDSSGPPIWAGIGLILLAALAGTTLARARNRRRMREYRDSHRD